MRDPRDRTQVLQQVRSTQPLDLLLPLFRSRLIHLKARVLYVLQGGDEARRRINEAAGTRTRSRTDEVTGMRTRSRIDEVVRRRTRVTR